MLVGEPRLNFFLKQEFRLAHQVTHFNEIQQGQLRNGVAVGFLNAAVLGQYVGPILAVCVQEVVQHRAVLKTGIHALSVKRNDGVGGVANEGDGSVELPGVAPHDDQGTGGVGVPLRTKIRHQGEGVGKNAGKKGFGVVGGG